MCWHQTLTYWRRRRGEAFEVGGGGRSFFPPYCGSSTHRWKPARRPAFKGLPSTRRGPRFCVKALLSQSTSSSECHEASITSLYLYVFLCITSVLCMRVKVWSKKNRITFSKLKKKVYQKIIIEIIFERTASGAVLTCVHAWRSYFFFQIRVLSK